MVEASLEDGGGLAVVLGGPEDDDRLGAVELILPGLVPDLVREPTRPGQEGEDDEDGDLPQEAHAPKPSLSARLLAEKSLRIAY